MRTYNRYILALVLASSLINLVLAFSGQSDLTFYFMANIIAYLVITLVSVYLNPRAKKLLGVSSAVLFAGFVVIVVIKAVEVLSGR